MSFDENSSRSSVGENWSVSSITDDSNINSADVCVSNDEDINDADEEVDVDYYPDTNDKVNYESRMGPLRKGKRLKVMVHQSTMTDEFQYPPVPLRNGRTIKPEVLYTLCNISFASKIPINAARRAFLEASKFFHQNYVLDVTEIPHEITTDGNIFPKRVLQLKKKYYTLFENKIPSYPAIFNFKHLMAIGYEISAASLLLEKKTTYKSVLLFDFTARKHLKGEWPALILQIGNTE